jgi:hypothetical protein
MTSDIRKNPKGGAECRLEWLLYQYEEHMRLHHMKVNRGVLETIITTVAECVEDVLKIRWGKVANSLFALRHQHLALLEAELKAPGREVAYIIKARNTFSS